MHTALNNRGYLLLSYIIHTNQYELCPCTHILVVFFSCSFLPFLSFYMHDVQDKMDWEKLEKEIKKLENEKDDLKLEKNDLNKKIDKLENEMNNLKPEEKVQYSIG